MKIENSLVTISNWIIHLTKSVIIKVFRLVYRMPQQFKIKFPFHGQFSPLIVKKKKKSYAGDQHFTKMFKPTSLMAIFLHWNVFQQNKQKWLVGCQNVIKFYAVIKQLNLWGGLYFIVDLVFNVWSWKFHIDTTSYLKFYF